MIARLLIALAIILVIAGCGTPSPPTEPASPAPLPAEVSRDQVVPPDGLAKDARSVSPCELITADQARRLGIDDSTAEPDPPGSIPGCGWRSADRSFDVAVKVDSTKGLANLYQGHALTPYKLFVPRRIEGYPAVRAEQIEDGLDCTIYVGLAETQALWVIGTDRKRRDSCAITRSVITAVLANLPPLR